MIELLDVALRSSAVLAAGLIARELLHRRSAALRHWILTGAMLASVAVVPLTLVLPAWTFSSTREAPVSPAPAAPATSTMVTVTAAAGTSARDAAVSLIPVVWLIGVFIGAAAFLSGIARLLRVTARATPVPDGRWTKHAAQLSIAYGLRRDVAILQTGSPQALSTWGVFKPCVLLPVHASGWGDERMHVVLCHELAHIRRHDWLVQMCAQGVRILYWFNPLAWIAWARLRCDSEQACDDAVLGAGVAPRVYAMHLLELARICRRPAAKLSLPIVGWRPSAFERRIADMLNPDIDRRVLSGRAAIVTALLLAGVTFPVAALRAGQTTPLPLKGSVYDPSGAVLPEVAITLEDAQHATIAATTDANGRFEFASIEPGTYTLDASLPGFRKLRQALQLRTTRDWDRAITLQVGDVQETITVSAPRRPGTPAAAASAPVRIGGNIRAPSKLRDVKPVYPRTMRDAGREGVVPLEAIIGRDGSVTSLRVLSAQVHPDFAMAAMDAVRQWRFDPTLLNGEPVEVVMSVSVTFALSD
jgi:TonB family protein